MRCARKWHYPHFIEDDRFIEMEGCYQDNAPNAAELGVDPQVSNF